MKTAFALLALILLLAGCSEKTDASADAPEKAGTPPSTFLVPDSDVSYTAHYLVNDQGGEIAKTVWRAGRKIRIDYGLSGASSAISMFLLENRAYSCGTSGGSMACFDISGKIDGSQLNELLGKPDITNSEEVESVNIGGTTGRCFSITYQPYQKRKVCVTDSGILAYDEYNATGSSARVEYLTSLKYSADESAFTLPSEPQEPAGNFSN